MVNLNRLVKLGKSVAIIARNTAIDSAAPRFGWAPRRCLLYRRTWDAMPAYAQEVQDALDKELNSSSWPRPSVCGRQRKQGRKKSNAWA
jgi:hypothetical protein